MYIKTWDSSRKNKGLKSKFFLSSAILIFLTDNIIGVIDINLIKEATSFPMNSLIVSAEKYINTDVITPLINSRVHASFRYVFISFLSKEIKALSIPKLPIEEINNKYDITIANSPKDFGSRNNVKLIEKAKNSPREMTTERVDQ